MRRYRDLKIELNWIKSHNAQVHGILKTLLRRDYICVIHIYECNIKREG